MVKCSETADLFFLAGKIWWIYMRQNMHSSVHVSKGLLIEVFTWKPQLSEESKVREENFCPLARICYYLWHQTVAKRAVFFFVFRFLFVCLLVWLVFGFFAFNVGSWGKLYFEST